MNNLCWKLHNTSQTVFIYQNMHIIEYILSIYGHAHHDHVYILRALTVNKVPNIICIFLYAWACGTWSELCKWYTYYVIYGAWIIWNLYILICMLWFNWWTLQCKSLVWITDPKSDSKPLLSFVFSPVFTFVNV